VAVAVVIALAGGLIAHALRQSVLVGYLLAGVVIGPFTPGFVGDRDQIAALAEVGVVFLMFALGIEFSLKELAYVRGVALVGTAIQVLLIVRAGVGLGAFLGWPSVQGVFFGGIVAISSTMVILKTLLDRGEVAARHGRVLLSMLIVQDLVAVILVVLLPKLGAGGGAVLGDLTFTLATAAAFVGATLFLVLRAAASGDHAAPLARPSHLAAYHPAGCAAQDAAGLAQREVSVTDKCPASQVRSPRTAYSAARLSTSRTVGSIPPHLCTSSAGSTTRMQ
jgi:predicted Kef-type K+ transport protein